MLVDIYWDKELVDSEESRGVKVLRGVGSVQSPKQIAESVFLQAELGYFSSEAAQ